MSHIIDIRNLKKFFGDIKAVDDITFSVEEGELFAFLGLNGAGKSTTINILVGVLKRDSGDCWMKFLKFYQVLELFFKHLYLIKNYLCMTI